MSRVDNSPNTITSDNSDKFSLAANLKTLKLRRKPKCRMKELH